MHHSADKKKTDAHGRTSTVKTPEVQALCEIAQLVGSAVELQTTLSEILRILHDTLYMERASLVLLDGSSEHLTIRASYGLTEEEMRRGVYHLNEGVIGKVFRSRFPFVVPDIKSEPLFLNRTQSRSIHHAGPRITRPFIKINCAAVPENLLESELLGHEKGAFTGATSFKKGRFELADGGTLFLDEIGELPLNLQAKLLRVLQEKNFERLGGTNTISVDVRIIAATNVNLEEAVARGRFRADLYYRLNVVPIMLPPLRDRREDIPLLLDFFLRESNERNVKQMKLSREAVEFLKNYTWPGNVREMQNLVERMVIISDDEWCKVSDLPSVMVAEPERRIINEQSDNGKVQLNESFRTGPKELKSSLKDMEKEIVESAMQRNGWVQARAARDLGISQRQIGYKMKKYGIELPEHIRIKSE